MNNDTAKHAVEQALAGGPDGLGLQWTADVNGNAFGWVDPCPPQALVALAPRFVAIGARLLTVTAYREDKFGRTDGHDIAYHFDVDGVVVTVTVRLDEAAPAVPSLTPWFRNADWNEREFAELYGITVTDHPHLRRLFIDKDLDADILDRLVPLSTLMNGASTTTLWEKVFAGKPLPQWTKGGQH